MLVVIFIVLIYSKISEKPFLVRICIHLIIVVYVLKWLNLEDRRSLDDFDSRIRQNQLLELGTTISAIIPMCLVEKAYFHLPVSVFYQFSISYGIFKMAYQRETRDQINFLYKEKWPMILELALYKFIIQYIVVIYILYQKN